MNKEYANNYNRAKSKEVAFGYIAERMRKYNQPFEQAAAEYRSRFGGNNPFTDEIDFNEYRNEKTIYKRFGKDAPQRVKLS